MRAARKPLAAGGECTWKDQWAAGVAVRPDRLRKLPDARIQQQPWLFRICGASETHADYREHSPFGLAACRFRSAFVRRCGMARNLVS
jgi:hypothetical protein